MRLLWAMFAGGSLARSALIPSIFHALAFFWLDGFAVPPPAQVTQAVGRLCSTESSQNGFYLKAEYIFNKLNEKGAGLGNASIFIIKEALQDLEAAQQTLAPDAACGHASSDNWKMDESGNMYCVLCRAGKA